MSPRVRWYNRLAAWLYEHNPVGDFLMELAIPVWEEQAEATLDELWEHEHDRQAEIADAYRDGRADEARERDMMEPF